MGGIPFPLGDEAKAGRVTLPFGKVVRRVREDEV